MIHEKMVVVEMPDMKSTKRIQVCAVCHGDGGALWNRMVGEGACVHMHHIVPTMSSNSITTISQQCMYVCPMQCTYETMACWRADMALCTMSSCCVMIVCIVVGDAAACPTGCANLCGALDTCAHGKYTHENKMSSEMCMQLCCTCADVCICATPTHDTHIPS